MDHELPPGVTGEELQPDQTADVFEPIEPTDREIDEAADRYKDEGPAEEERRRQQDRESFARMEKISDELAAQRAAASTPDRSVSFNMPSAAQIKFDKAAQERSAAFDRRDDQAGLNGFQITKELSGKGMVIPKTAEEIEAEEVAAISAHAATVHRPKTSRPKTLWRAKGPIQRDIADNDQKVKTERQLRGEI